MYGATLGNHRYNFSRSVETLLREGLTFRSGDILAGLRYNLVKNGLLRNLRSQICYCALSIFAFQRVR